MIDFVVIGGGIAGVSAAAHLAPHGRVTLLEMEETLAYHTTGRSAAMFVVNYGAQGTRPLALASGPFLRNPPQGSTDGPLLSERGLLWIGDPTRMGQLEEMAQVGQGLGAGSVMVSQEEALDLVPCLLAERVAGGLHEPDAHDIDVAGLHQAFVRIARRHQAEIRTETRVVGIGRTKGGWMIETTDSPLDCQMVVNASGAWGDVVAASADVRPIGLRPMRRTAFMVPGSEASAQWPMVVEADQRFYFKPDGVQFLCSLAEENPSEPGDPRPRMEDVALAIDRINKTTTLGIRSVNSQWTGLRTFSPDREMVIGEDPTAPGFFWLVGQGGVGIQTSPAYGALIAALVTETPLPQTLLDAEVDPEIYSPARFR